MEPGQRDGDAAAGEAHAIRHFGDDADLRVGLVVPGDEQYASSPPTSTGSVMGIPGKYHDVIERDESEPVHSRIMVSKLLQFVNYLVHHV